MKNMIQDGETLTLPAPRDVKSGDGVLVGRIFGVAATDAAAGEDVQLKRRGVFKLAKTSAQAWTNGVPIYWDDTNFICTTSDVDTVLIGAATAVAANPSDAGNVLLDGTVR